MLEMKDDSRGNARLVLRLAPETRHQIIELDKPDENEGNHFDVAPRSYCRGKGGVRSKIGYAGHSGIAEGFVRSTEEHVRERRDPGRKGNLRPKKISIQMKIAAVCRAVIAAEVRNRAEPGDELIISRKFPAVRIHVNRAEASEFGRAPCDGASSRRDYDHRPCYPNRSENLDRVADVRITAENFKFVLGPERCGRK